MFMDWKDKYCQDDCATQGNLQFQYSPFQITNDIYIYIFWRSITKIHNVNGNTKDPEKPKQLINKSSWRDQAS